MTLSIFISLKRWYRFKHLLLVCEKQKILWFQDVGKRCILIDRNNRDHKVQWINFVVYVLVSKR